MSEHAAVKEKHRKLATQIYVARSRYECGAATNMETDADAQLLANFARDERLKEAELRPHQDGCAALLTGAVESDCNDWCGKNKRIAQLKRGEL